MKHLLTLTALLLTFSGLAQQMPYNPDANGDDFVGVDDVLGVLGVYDTALMQPDLQCDYEGTELEALIIGISEGSLVLDSVYIEYLLLDTLEYFLPGCPDLVSEPVTLERGYTVFGGGLEYSNDGLSTSLYASSNFFNYGRSLFLQYSGTSNSFRMRLRDYEVEAVTSFQDVAYWNGTPYTSGGTEWMSLPFDELWSLDEEGIHVTWFGCCEIYPSSQWAGNCEYLRIIPFWHEAE